MGKCVPNQSESLRGIMMAVEYLPLSSRKKPLPGHFMRIESNLAEYGLSDHYTSQQTAAQYATCMAQLIAEAGNSLRFEVSLNLIHAKNLIHGN